MPRRAPWASLLLLAGCAATSARPAPAPPAPPAPAGPTGPVTARPADVRRDVRRIDVDVDVDQVELSEVMDRIGRQIGRSVLVDPSVQERVTVSLQDIDWREAVDVIARMTRCEVEERPGGVLVLTQQCVRVHMNFEDANVRAVLQLVAAYHGANVILPPDLRGRVDVDHALTGDVAQALQQVLAPLDGEFVVLVEQGGSLVRVTAPVVEGQVVTHDEDALWLRAEAFGGPVQLRLPPPSATGALGERRRALLRELGLTRRGDRVRARCAWRDDGPELVELLGD